MALRAAALCVASLLVAQLATAQTLDLTGAWRDDRGTRYAVRQIGNTVYWSMDGRPQVHNVFYGTIVGSTITGTWADLPGGQLQNSGGLMLRIQSNDRLMKAAEDPMSTYGASVWVRESGGAAPAGCVGFSGNWDTNWGVVTLAVVGNRATGTYPGTGNTIRGTVSGNVLDGEWIQPDRPGRLRFELAPDGRSFRGSWTEATGPRGGEWNGTCAAAAR